MIFNNIISKKKSLLKELNSLGYSDRIQKIIFLANDMDDTEYRKLLYSLLEDGQYEANLALIGATVIRDCEIVKKALVHNKNSIRIKASKLLAKYGSADEIENEISNLSYECCKKFLNTIRNLNCREKADRLFPIVYSKYGAEQARIIFPICSHEIVEKYIDEIGHEIYNWYKIAVYHRDIFMNYFKKSLEEAKDRERVYVWNRFSDGVNALVMSNGQFILDCAINFQASDNMYSILEKYFGVLARKDSSKVYNILLSEECRKEFLCYGVPKCLLKKKESFTINQWIKIGRILKDKNNHIINILQALPYSNREEFFYGIYDENEINKKIFNVQILKELPHKLRSKIAMNILNIKEVINDKYKYINILACCDIEFSREILEKETKSSNAEDRSLALKLMVRSTAVSRKEISETLSYLSRIKNDQDPVKREVLEELSNCPPLLFKNVDVNNLEVISNSVLEARDTSYDTLSYLGKFAFKILKYNVDKNDCELFKFALNVLISISKRRGRLFLFKLSDIRKEFQNIIFQAFYPFLKDSNKRESYECTIQMAGLLGKHGYYIVKLQELLKEAVMSNNIGCSKQAAKYYLACPENRDERVKEMLEIDKSFICVDEVFFHLHRRRQEWLDIYIKGILIKGKFLSGKTIYLIPAVDGFNKYLPYQQKNFSELLEKVSSNSKYSYYERHRAIHAAAKMPDINLKYFNSFINSSEVCIVESALHALSTTEEPEKAVEVLINNLDGDIAKIAMYSIPRCIRNVNPQLAGKVINKLLKREHLKITVKKEVIRLLGDYRSKENIELLLNEAEKENVNTDVQIAIGHSIRKYLDHESAWKVLGRFVESNENNVIKSLLNQNPNELSKKYRNEYLKLILKIASLNDNEISKTALNRMKNWISVDDVSIADFAYKVLIDLNDISRWKQALDLLIAVAVYDNINKYLIDIVKFMVNVKITKDMNVQCERDMPHRQRLNMLINRLTSLDKMVKRKLIPLFKEIIKLIESDKTLKKMSIKLYVACMDFDNLITTVQYINYIGKIIKERPYFAEFSYNEILTALTKLKGHYDPQNLIKSIDDIISKDINEELYISLALLETAGNDLLWTKECCEKLKFFRDYSNIEVSSKALDIWIALE